MGAPPVSSPNPHAAARESYDRLSGVYDLLSARSERPARDLGLACLDARPGEQVAELGCGTGLCLADLSSRVGPTGFAIGVDLSPGMLDQARRRILSGFPSPTQVALLQGDATALPLATGSVDALLTTFTLELFPEPELPRVLAECARVLKPAGRLVAVSLSSRGPATVARRIYEWSHRAFPQLVDCRPIHLEASLAASGFSPRRAEAMRLFGLPVECVVAAPPAPSPGR